MKISIFGVRLEVCWDEEPDTEPGIDEPVWVKTVNLDAQVKEYDGIVASARRTGIYL